MPDLFAYLEGFGTGESFTKSVIIVTDLPTGATVTATKGPIRKTTTEKNGEWWFKGLDLGEWTLDAALDGETATTKFNIERFGVYYVPMSFFKATIQTKYPVGSTCTCSKGDKTFTAPDTSGQYDFVVDSAGEWTVSCTDGAEKKDSEVAEITENGQRVEITLAYELLLYNYGDTCDDVTGGWVKSGASNFKLTFESDHMYLDNSGNEMVQGSAITQNNIAKGDFTTLKVELTHPLNYSDSYFSYGGAKKMIPKQLSEKTVLDLDISSASDSSKINIYKSYGKMSIYKVWMV